jgi:hypothetical protein
MVRPELRGLYAVTPDCADGARLLADVEAALAGGCRLVQYRDKLSAMPEQVSRARKLRELTRRFGARLLINDDLALATLVEADGVHLGRDDGNLVAARAILGPDRILGASCYADFAAGGRRPPMPGPTTSPSAPPIRRRPSRKRPMLRSTCFFGQKAKSPRRSAPSAASRRITHRR